jgi:hypothetical protein
VPCPQKTTASKHSHQQREAPTRMPVACPFGRRTGVIHGHSRTGGQAPDLHQHWSAPSRPQPSKLVIPVRSRSPAPLLQPRSAPVFPMFRPPLLPFPDGLVPHACHTLEILRVMLAAFLPLLALNADSGSTADGMISNAGVGSTVPIGPGGLPPPHHERS